MFSGGPSLCFLSGCREAARSEPVDGQNTSAERTCCYDAGVLHTIYMDLREEDMCMDMLLFSICILSHIMAFLSGICAFVSSFKLEKCALAINIQVFLVILVAHSHFKFLL